MKVECGCGRAELKWSQIFEAVTGLEQGTCVELELCHIQYEWQCFKTGHPYQRSEQLNSDYKWRKAVGKLIACVYLTIVLEYFRSR